MGRTVRCLVGRRQPNQVSIVGGGAGLGEQIDAGNAQRCQRLQIASRRTAGGFPRNDPHFELREDGVLPVDHTIVVGVVLGQCLVAIDCIEAIGKFGSRSKHLGAVGNRAVIIAVQHQETLADGGPTCVDSRAGV